MKNILYLILLISVSLIFQSCSDDPEDILPLIPSFTLSDCIPQNGFPSTASSYAEMVESELGIVPTVHLDSMIEIPLYQNGQQVYGVFYDANSLDNPTRLGKLTVSGSALKRYQGISSDGSILPNVVWVAFLRNVTEYITNPEGSLQIIGYNQLSGATAFFESMDNVGQFVSNVEPITFKLSGVMPGPNSNMFNQAYRTPSSDFQCISCHQADPFITNPFINAAKIPGTNESVVPHLGANSPYHVIGGYDWDMRTIHIEGNQCMACHRLGLSTVRLFEDNGYDVNTHMPPTNPGSLSDDYLELLEAWINGPENTPGAEWKIPPTCNDPGKIVGDDYPYKQPFNNYGF